MFKLTAALCLAALILIPPGAVDTVHAQGGLTPGEPVTGIVSAGQPVDFIFNGTAGEVISLRVSGDDALDPVLTLLDSSDRVLISNDDYAYPASRDALLEAITLPRTGLYTARVGGFGGSAGAFTLTLQRGFAGDGYSDGFAAGRGWRAADPGSVRVNAGTLVVGYAGQGSISALNATQPTFSDFYTRVEVVAIRASEPGWIAGLTARYASGVQIALQIRADGTWRILEQDGDAETVLRDWSIHPAIIAGQTSFSVAMLARNRGFHMFYNDTLLGTIPTPSIAGEAQIGLVAGIQRPLPQEATITYDNLMINTPLRVADELVLPQQFTVGDSQTLLYALTRRHQVPVTGQLSLTVPESTVQFARSGVNRLIVGGGISYQDFVMGATVDITQNSVGLGGCGLVLRSQSEDDYGLAFFDSAGGYGLSVQAQGEFQPGLFSQGLDEGRTHHLLVIADDTTLYLYVDGRAAGTLITPDVPGQVGGAVVNYDAVDTLCTFRNLWVYSWED